MEEQDFTNKTIIDIGTGSGILMIAGKLLGAGEVYGTDIDEVIPGIISNSISF